MSWLVTDPGTCPRLSGPGLVPTAPRTQLCLAMLARDREVAQDPVGILAGYLVSGGVLGPCVGIGDGLGPCLGTGGGLVPTSLNPPLQWVPSHLPSSTLHWLPGSPSPARATPGGSMCRCTGWAPWQVSQGGLLSGRWPGRGLEELMGVLQGGVGLIWGPLVLWG